MKLVSDGFAKLVHNQFCKIGGSKGTLGSFLAKIDLYLTKNNELNQIKSNEYNC